MSFLDDIASVAKAVVKSPITKVVAGGIAIVAPPVGLSALAGIAAADKVVDAIDSGKSVVAQAQNALNAARAGVPGGRVPLVASARLSPNMLTRAKQASTAANVVTATAALAKAGDPLAARNVKLLQIVQQAKQGQPKAVALLHQEVKKQVNHVLAAGKAPNATPEEKKMAELTGRLLKATVARKQYARKFAVNTRTARVHRVA